MTPQNLVFRDQWASFREGFQGLDLFFDSLDEFLRVHRNVMSDKIPNFLAISFCSPRNSNAKLCGHP